MLTVLTWHLLTEAGPNKIDCSTATLTEFKAFLKACGRPLTVHFQAPGVAQLFEEGSGTGGYCGPNSNCQPFREQNSFGGHSTAATGIRIDVAPEPTASAIAACSFLKVSEARAKVLELRFKRPVLVLPEPVVRLVTCLRNTSRLSARHREHTNRMFSLLHKSHQQIEQVQDTIRRSAWSAATTQDGNPCMLQRRQSSSDNSPRSSIGSAALTDTVVNALNQREISKQGFLHAAEELNKNVYGRLSGRILHLTEQEDELKACIEALKPILLFNDAAHTVEVHHTWQDGGSLGITLRQCGVSKDSAGGAIVSKVNNLLVPGKLQGLALKVVAGELVTSCTFNEVTRKVKAAERPLTITFGAAEDSPVPSDGAEAIATALSAFESWEQQALPDYVVSASTNGMQELHDLMSLHLTFVPHVDSAAIQMKLRHIHHLLSEEITFWQTDPITLLPLSFLLACATAAQLSFRQEIAQAQQQLEEIERAKHLVAQIKDQVKPTTDQFARFFDLSDELFDLKECVIDAQHKVEAQHRAAARRRAVQGALETSQAELADAQAQVLTTSKQLESMKRHLSGLSKHFPELALEFPDADLLGVCDLDGLCKPGISLESFDETIKTITTGRHVVMVTALQGIPCVLKEFTFESDRDKSKFEKEAKRLHSLDHPHIIKISSVVFGSNRKAYIHMPFYAGENMAIWLEKHNPSMEQRRVALHGVLSAVSYLHNIGVLHCGAFR